MNEASSSIENEPNAANAATVGFPITSIPIANSPGITIAARAGSTQREQIAVARANPTDQTRQAGEAHAQIMTTRRCSSKTTNQYDPYRTVLGGESAVP